LYPERPLFIAPMEARNLDHTNNLAFDLDTLGKACGEQIIMAARGLEL
jgi:hypothetical protein